MEILLGYLDKALKWKAAAPAAPKPPTPEQAVAFQVGQFVVIAGLQTRAELNELEAIVQEILPTGRVQVIWRKRIHSPREYPHKWGCGCEGTRGARVSFFHF